jgi:hypothetical protein
MGRFRWPGPQSRRPGKGRGKTSLVPYAPPVRMGFVRDPRGRA